MPADDEHPYGHHKAEYFSSGFEGILILVAALGIIWVASHRLFDPQPIEQVGWGLALSVGSSALNGFLAWLMFRAARQHRSLALEADARHLVTDVWTSAGVVVGIALVSVTGWLWLDAVVAIGVALNILKEGWSLVWRSSQGLMDEALEPEVLADVQRVLDGFAHQRGDVEIIRNISGGDIFVTLNALGNTYGGGIGMGHRNDFRGTADPDLTLLRQWIGDDHPGVVQRAVPGVDAPAGAGSAGTHTGLRAILKSCRACPRHSDRAQSTRCVARQHR